ncbi:AAEL010067-PA [Aedes aegypti]|uniref:AAEL010067-PA n=1 Tax=Aedes aegypti TaxID=7159 RepID=Q16TZ2_AEDAE|nr:AAEL010067-PA [Aedes aegypti]
MNAICLILLYSTESRITCTSFYFFFFTHRLKIFFVIYARLAIVLYRKNSFNNQSFFLFSLSDACSSRTTPKPRPPSPTARPNITFHTYKCPPAYAAWYCLNEATCFTVKIGDSLLYNCECADGYMGPRCEYKDLDGSYLPTRPRVMLETASIASGAIVALVLAVIVWCYICVHKHQQKKRLETANGGVDTVDGVLRTVRSENLPKRPFGSHHLRTIPLSESLSR